MGKFKQMEIDLQETEDELVQSIKENMERRKTEEECNCDQALQLQSDLQIAIKFGVEADDYIRGLQFIITELCGLLLDNDILTEKELLDSYGIARQKTKGSTKH